LAYYNFKHIIEKQYIKLKFQNIIQSQVSMYNTSATNYIINQCI